MARARVIGSPPPGARGRAGPLRWPTARPVRARPCGRPGTRSSGSSGRPASARPAESRTRATRRSLGSTSRATRPRSSSWATILVIDGGWTTLEALRADQGSQVRRGGSAEGRDQRLGQAGLRVGVLAEEADQAHRREAQAGGGFGVDHRLHHLAKLLSSANYSQILLGFHGRAKVRRARNCSLTKRDGVTQLTLPVRQPQRHDRRTGQGSA